MMFASSWETASLTACAKTAARSWFSTGKATGDDFVGNVVRWSEEQLAAHRQRAAVSTPPRREEKAPESAKAQPLPVAIGSERDQGMNKLESSYARHLEAMKSAGHVLWWKYEAVGLRLADRTFYHPDFMVMMADGTLEIHETKGFMQEDANVKLKVAACAFPFVFKLVKKHKGGAWDIRTI